MPHSVCDQTDSASVHAQFDSLVESIADKLPKAADHLAETHIDVLTFTAFPKKMWRQARSTNPSWGRLNREIRRPTWPVSSATGTP
ncbi:MAG: putative transposase [Actinomycetota bacterium]|nr:putative transposase [Actinomycetota bacterium]